MAQHNIFGDDQAVIKRLHLMLDVPRRALTAPPLLTAANIEAWVSGDDAADESNVMRSVDLTLLDLKASKEQVREIALRAAQEHCATVCVYPEHVAWVQEVMDECGVTDVPPIAVVGFPRVEKLNSQTTVATLSQTEAAIAMGAREIDMVLPFEFREVDVDGFCDVMEACSALNSSGWSQGNQAGIMHATIALGLQFEYLCSIIKAADAHGVPVKVILETAYLSDAQIVLASMMCKIAGARWVKTSTGFAQLEYFAPGRTPDEKGATPRSVALMRQAVGYTTFNEQGDVVPMGVKASGGVRNKAQAVALLRAGCDRIGASGGFKPDDESSGAGY